jgi:hypothetical protein
VTVVAVFITNNNDTAPSHHEVDFAAIWEHYSLARFLYPAKLERLKPVMNRISKGWPALLDAPADIFQLHVSCKDRKVVSSVCAFRDANETHVLQHAVSQDQPWHMIDCIQSMTTAMGDDPGVQFVSMYFRPENRWPVRFVRTVSDVHPPELTRLKTQEYVICRPGGAFRVLPAEVEELGEDAKAEVASIAIASLGHLQSSALGMGAHQHDSKALGERYAAFGLLRERKLLGAFRDGALAGVALCHVSGFPMNFSFLCSRVEILAHPEAPDRANIVSDLARAAIREAVIRNETVCALLIDPEDAQAAVAGGFKTTGKQYSNFLWARENEQGWPSCAMAFERWYERIIQRYVRTHQRSDSRLQERS